MAHQHGAGPSGTNASKQLKLNKFFLANEQNASKEKLLAQLEGAKRNRLVSTIKVGTSATVNQSSTHIHPLIVKMNEPLVRNYKVKALPKYIQPEDIDLYEDPTLPLDEVDADQLPVNDICDVGSSDDDPTDYTTTGRANSTGVHQFLLSKEAKELQNVMKNKKKAKELKRTEKKEAEPWTPALERLFFKEVVENIDYMYHRKAGTTFTKLHIDINCYKKISAALKKEAGKFKVYNTPIYILYPYIRVNVRLEFCYRVWTPRVSF